MQASITEVKKLVEEEQQAYIRDEQHARAQEEAIRHVHQRQADAATKASLWAYNCVLCVCVHVCVAL